jgi:peptidoglycan/LPS O-acetylase OafA/YrhL
MDNQEKCFRNKITFIQFVLSIGIVYQHTQWNYTGSIYLNATQTFLFYLIETCVPFFFMISGYLFFRTFKIQNLKQKLFSRVKTLLIPYLLWNTIYMIFIVGLSSIGLINNATVSNTRGGVFLQLINAEFSPLWFVKYLMFFTLISPIMWFLLKRKFIGVLTIVVMIIVNVWAYYSGHMEIPLNVNANNWIMLNYQYIFYAVGAYCALNFREFIEKPMRAKTISGIGILFMLFAIYVLVISKFNNAIISHSFRLIYICALWFAFDAVPRFKVCNWMSNSFFIYCSHLMILQCVQRVCDILIGKTGHIQPLLYVVEYIFLPMVIIGCLIVFAELLKNKAPKLWGILTGSRG